MKRDNERERMWTEVFNTYYSRGLNNYTGCDIMAQAADRADEALKLFDERFVTPTPTPSRGTFR